MATRRGRWRIGYWRSGRSRRRPRRHRGARRWPEAGPLRGAVRCFDGRLGAV